MGRDGKRKAEDDDLKHKKRSKKSLSSSPDLRRERGDGEEGSTKRKEKKDKSRKRKHHVKSHHKKHPSSHEKKSGDKHKAISRKHGSHSKLKHQELSGDDYFSKNNEFATWLKEEKSVFFSDLSSESARDLFSEFVLRWNDCKLDPRYYEGIAAGPRTSHKWNIRN